MSEIPKTQDEIITAKVAALMSPYQSEISKRNVEIQKRDDYIYGEALMRNATFATNGDRTEYNWLERLVDIHVSQLMGRGFGVYSTYDKRDLSIAADIEDPKQIENDKMINKRLKMNADARRSLAHSILDENGGEELFQVGAELGSAYGFTVFKSWLGDKKKAWNLEALEHPQNFWAIWGSTSYRDMEACVYMYQINSSTAMRQYGRWLKEGETFKTNPEGTIPENPSPESPTEAAGSAQMVTVMEFTGYMPEVKGDNGDLFECDAGEETRINLLIVGGKVMRIETEEEKIPRYYIVPNRRAPRRPWGKADVTSTCIEINRTYIERMSDWVTLGNKLLYTKFKAIGFDVTNAPRWKSRTTEAIPMDADQDIKAIDVPTQFSYEFPSLVGELKENFVRSGRISRVLFDDPQAAGSNSNQALMTSMKGTIDAVEKKQKIWQRFLVDMLDDAVRTLARKYPSIAEFVDGEEDWNFYVKWPSVLRKEDPVYQQMVLNNFNSGGMSVDTLLEEQGVRDPGEELDRIRDNMSDPVTAAIMGRQLPLLAQQTIAPPPDPNAPKPPDIRHSVNWQAQMTPQQEANLAAQMGFQEGPFGMSMGPQGAAGKAAGENASNEGFIEGNAFAGGTPINRNEKGEEVGNAPTKQNQKGVDSKDGTAPPAQVATPDQNQPGTGVVSQPGSGQQPPVSAQGALNQSNQNNGG